jgi:hypothetical protein
MALLRRMRHAQTLRQRRADRIYGRAAAEAGSARRPKPDLATDESVEPCLLGCQVPPLSSI